MGKKSDSKGKGKGSQLVIRIEKAEREAFVDLCDRLDTSAAREIRRFMRGFVAAHATAGDGAATGSPPEARPEDEPSLAVEPTAGTARAETAAAPGDA